MYRFPGDDKLFLYWQHGKGSLSSVSTLLGTHGELLSVVFSPLLGFPTSSVSPDAGRTSDGAIRSNRLTSSFKA